MKTDEDDEFDRIEHEVKMKNGQPYHWDVYVSPSQRNQVLEEVAKELAVLPYGVTSAIFADFVRNMKND
jgi:predicted nuclease of restriction endonuclease-like RecB superfamily